MSLTQDAAAGGKKNKEKKYHSRLPYLAHRDTLRYTSNGVMEVEGKDKTGVVNINTALMYS